MTQGAGDLVRRAAAGDQKAWDDLVQRFAGLVWAVTRGFRLSAGDAADVSQIVWLRLVEHLDRLHDPDRVGAWLATTARNECLRALRQAGASSPLDQDRLDAADATIPPPDSRLLDAERDVALWSAFDTLPARCQALLRLLVVDPPTRYEEVSAALDMPVGAIGPTRRRCLEQLRKRLAVTRITAATDSSSRGRRQ